MTEKKNQKNEEDLGIEKKFIAPIKLTPPEPPKWKVILFRLTWWRPATKKDIANTSLMILKLSEGILNMGNMQKVLIKNNNALMKYCEGISQQMQGQQMAKDMKEAADRKRMANDKAFQ